MKQIQAIIQPFRLDEVVEALMRIEGLPGMTAYKVRGFGRGRAVHGVLGIMEEQYSAGSRIRIELVVADEMVKPVLETICAAARTGRPGDGKIFVVPVEEMVRIRTGEHGEAAL